MRVVLWLLKVVSGFAALVWLLPCALAGIALMLVGGLGGFVAGLVLLKVGSFPLGAAFGWKVARRVERKGRATTADELELMIWG